MTWSLRTRAATIAAGLAFAASADAQTLTHRYELNGSFADALGGPAMTPHGGTLDATGYRFGVNQGPSLVGALATGSVYGIEMYFSIDNVSGWRSILNFKNLASETGLYNYSDDLALWVNGTVKSKEGMFANGQLAHLVVGRSAAHEFSAYVNGQLAFTHTDPSGSTAFSAANNPIWILNDNGGEEPSGVLDFVRIYDAPLSAADVRARYDATVGVTTTPEPGTWALLGTGLLALGAAARRRRA